MERVKLGTKVRHLGINRTNVAEGYRCRAILIDPDPRIKYIAWDEDLKKKVEVNQDLIIRFGLRPMTQFFYLIAKLNTDMNGTVVGDQFEVEYLQLSENVNNEFADALVEMDTFASLLLTKVTKKGDSGKDFSYIKVTPSSYDVSSEIKEKVEKLRADPQAIESMWTMIDKSTSISSEDYIKLKSSDVVAKPALENKHTQKAIAASPEPMPHSVDDFGSFASGDDFGDDFGN